MNKGGIILLPFLLSLLALYNAQINQAPSRVVMEAGYKPVVGISWSRPGTNGKWDDGS